MYNSNEYNELIMHLENHEDKETSIHGPHIPKHLYLHMKPYWVV